MNEVFSVKLGNLTSRESYLRRHGQAIRRKERGIYLISSSTVQFAV